MPLREIKLDVPPDRLGMIFSNIEVIYQYNIRLLELLEKVIIEGDTSNSIGKIFLGMVRKKYYPWFIVN